MTSTIDINNRTVGIGHPTYVVAEVAQAHDGSLGTAHAYIDAAAKAGADAVKFQTHIAHAESTPGEPFRVNFSKQDATRYEYWQRMEFTETQWAGLKNHCDEVGVDFLSSPFSTEAIELLERLDIPAWKIGAGETNNIPMLERLAATGKPVLLSSGMSPWDELDTAVATIVDAGAQAAIYQCTTSYPCPADKLGLNVLEELRSRYEIPVGLSDHSGTIFSGLAAAALGANLIEVHITFSKSCFGPDVSSSLTLEEFATLVEGTRFINTATANPVDKNQAAAGMSELRMLFTKSIVVTRNLPTGHILTKDDLALKKPGTGIPAHQLSNILGRRLITDVQGETLLQEQDFE